MWFEDSETNFYMVIVRDAQTLYHRLVSVRQPLLAVWYLLTNKIGI